MWPWRWLLNNAHDRIILFLLSLIFTGGGSMSSLDQSISSKSRKDVERPPFPYPEPPGEDSLANAR